MLRAAAAEASERAQTASERLMTERSETAADAALPPRFLPPQPLPLMLSQPISQPVLVESVLEGIEEANSIIERLYHRRAIHTQCPLTPTTFNSRHSLEVTLFSLRVYSDFPDLALSSFSASIHFLSLCRISF